MSNLPIFTSIAIDILSIIALFYIIIILGIAERKSKASRLTIKFERLKREKIFRNSLVLLALSFVFSFMAVYGALFGACNDSTAEILRLISKTFLFVFIVYLIRTLKYATIKEPSIK